MSCVVSPPLAEELILSLRTGDSVLINGIVYTARDAAHQRMVDSLETGEKLPFDLNGQVIYYLGPAPARPGQIIGSAGPTTSSRMDSYTPCLLAHGLKGMIGKGERSSEVISALQKYRAVYFGALGGAGALLAQCIKKVDIIAYDDLGPEAVRRLEVENLPVFVINDIYGGDLYREGRLSFLREQESRR